MKERCADHTSWDSPRGSVVHDVLNASMVLPPAVMLCYEEKEKHLGENTSWLQASRSV